MLQWEEYWQSLKECPGAQRLKQNMFHKEETVFQMHGSLQKKKGRLSGTPSVKQNPEQPVENIMTLQLHCAVFIGEHAVQKDTPSCWLPKTGFGGSYLFQADVDLQIG